MSTVNVNTINPVQANEPLNFQTGGTTFVQLTTAGHLSGGGGTLTVAGTVSAGAVAATNAAKAWVNFDGTTNSGGNCTIRASYNVSSVTDNGTGDYTVNFATAMTDANYVMAGSVLNSTHSHSGDTSHRLPMPQKDGYLASYIRVFTKYGNSTGEGQEDEDIVNVIIFGN